jgi:hypothetical protein
MVLLEGTAVLLETADETLETAEELDSSVVDSVLLVVSLPKPAADGTLFFAELAAVADAIDKPVKFEKKPVSDLSKAPELLKTFSTQALPRADSHFALVVESEELKSEPLKSSTTTVVTFSKTQPSKRPCPLVSPSMA